MPAGNETRLALKQLDNYDYEKQDIPGREYFEVLRTASPFADKLKERAIELGFSGDTSDTKGLRDFLFQAIKEEAGLVSEENEKNWKDNLRNWFIPKKRSPSPTMPSDREDVYRLCFALKMYGDKAAEFFEKGYLEQPYNFKDLKEAVYFYCLNNGLHYEDFVALLKKAEAFPIENDNSAETNTYTIGRTISDFHDEESFLDYIRQNRQSFEMQSTRANQEIARLKAECIELAQEEAPLLYSSDYQDKLAERDKRVEEGNFNQRDSLPQKGSEALRGLEKLISAIFDPDEPQSLRKINKIDDYFSNAPVLINSSLITNHMQAYEVDMGKDSPSLKRKRRGLLILLTFYHYFAALRVNNRETNKESFQEFVDLANETLERCGYGMLYVRNPYDWMFLYCAKHYEPLDAFRDLIVEFYIGNDFFVAKVTELKEETMLVEVVNKGNCGPIEGNQVCVSTDKILELLHSDTSFVTDNYVRIEFDGDFTKSNPSRLGEIYRIDVTDIDGKVIKQPVKNA